jgi:hypothetical protein
LRGAVSARSYSRSSLEDKVALSNGKTRHVLKTITDRAEIQKIIKPSSTRNGYQVR